MGQAIRVGAVGYGASFNMGKHHLSAISGIAGLEPVAVCDIDPERLVAAQEDFPGIAVFSHIDELLASDCIDLATIITPHNTHAELVLRCLEAKRHTVCEKPLAITSDEVTAMLAAARKNAVMLSTFHNRRWDGDFLTLCRIVREGLIGRVFRIECGFSSYSKARDWWRSDKEISGGAIYDWGAHFTDWVLNLVDYEIASVTGFQVKNPHWHGYTNEDHAEFTIHFKEKCLATLTLSTLSMESKDRWRVLGEQGSIVYGNDCFVVRSLVKGYQMETEIPFAQGDWHAYYRNIADHLLRGGPLAITPESAARVIGVLDAADRSAANGGEAVVPVFC